MDEATAESTPSGGNVRATSATAWEPFPNIDLRQLLRLTDDTGMFQHATHLLPDPTHGYCIDDNCRALIAAVLHAQLRGYDEQVVPLQRYLAFCGYAFNPDNGRFRNFMSYDRRWLEDAGSEDSHARTIWALGVTVNRSPSEAVRDYAKQLFKRALPACREFVYPRPWAYVVLGLVEYLKAEPEDAEAKNLLTDLTGRLFEMYSKHATDDWPWWEDFLTWGNARLPHAMLAGGRALGRQDMIDAGLKSLAWCIDVQTAPDGHLTIIGNHGWLQRGKEKAQFDQQPLEAYAIVHACLVAADITGDESWAERAWRAFEWFTGANDLGVPLYKSETGGCQDGLNADGPNANQGAESSLAYLLSVLELHRYRAKRSGRVRRVTPRTLGLAIIGASSFAKFCLEQYSQIDGIKPVAVWNRTTEKAHRLASERGLTAYDDLDDMLARPEVHIVHVATTPALHAEHALAALQRGKHVLCEKPIATNLADAGRMIAAAAQRDCRLGVNFMMRYGPLVDPVSELIRTQMLGAPLRGTFTNRAGDEGLPEGHWFWDESQSGGIFVEHGVHFFDLVRFWLGDASVMHAMRLRRPSERIIDQVSCELRYGTQTSFTYYHGFLQASPLDQQDMRLIFERGQLTLRGWVASEVEVEALLDEDAIARLSDLFPNSQIETLERFEGDRRIARHRGQTSTIDRRILLRSRVPDDKQTIYGQALRALMEDFIESIREPQTPPLVTAEDGRAALALALEADRIAKGVTP